MGAPGRILFLMVVNVAVEAVVGAFPLVGDLFDAAWKANQRNASLLNAWLDVPGAPPAPAWGPALLVLTALLVLAVVTVALVVTMTWWAVAILLAP